MLYGFDAEGVNVLVSLALVLAEFNDSDDDNKEDVAAIVAESDNDDDDDDDIDTEAGNCMESSERN
jgi:hypothetical protein